MTSVSILFICSVAIFVAAIVVWSNNESNDYAKAKSLILTLQGDLNGVSGKLSISERNAKELLEKFELMKTEVAAIKEKLGLIDEKKIPQKVDFDFSMQRPVSFSPIQLEIITRDLGKKSLLERSGLVQPQAMPEKLAPIARTKRAVKKATKHGSRPNPN